MQTTEGTRQDYGTSASSCDYILRSQLERLQPHSIVDFGAGGGKNGKIAKQHLSDNVKIFAVEGCKKTAEMLPSLGVYDQVYHALIGDWLHNDKCKYDLAIFGDVLEHLNPKQIHETLKICLERFKHIIIVCPLYDIFQEEAYNNPLEVHQTYIYPAYFDMFNYTEKHVVKGHEWTIMNIYIHTECELPPRLVRLSRSLFHVAMLLLQPVGLARPFVNLLKRYALKYKWLIGR